MPGSISPQPRSTLHLTFVYPFFSAVGLQYDVVQHELSQEVRGEGLHFGPPGFDFIKFPAVFNTLVYSNLVCLNRDGVQIRLNVSFQYRPLRNSIYALAFQFRNSSNYEEVIETEGASVVHTACSEFNTTELQTNRTQFEDVMRMRMELRVRKFFTNVSDVQVRNIFRPSAFEDAVRNKERARENVNVVRNMRTQRITEAMTTFREAQTNASITLDRAQSDARVTLTRAQTDAMAILDEFEREADSYARIVATQNLTVEGLLAYLGNRLIGESQTPILGNVDPPAKSSYADEL